jgi:hypothetical protein
MLDGTGSREHPYTAQRRGFWRTGLGYSSWICTAPGQRVTQLEVATGYANTISYNLTKFILPIYFIQGVPGGKVSILGDHSIGHSKKKNCLYEHVFYSEQLPK